MFGFSICSPEGLLSLTSTRAQFQTKFSNLIHNKLFWVSVFRVELIDSQSCVIHKQDMESAKKPLTDVNDLMKDELLFNRYFRHAENAFTQVLEFERHVFRNVLLVLLRLNCLLVNLLALIGTF